jgi:hypothetical protein
MIFKDLKLESGHMFEHLHHLLVGGFNSSEKYESQLG